MSNELLLEGLPGKSETLASPPVFALLLMALTRILQLPEQKSKGFVHAEARFPAVPWRYESKSLLKLLLTDWQMEGSHFNISMYMTFDF